MRHIQGTAHVREPILTIAGACPLCQHMLVLRQTRDARHFYVACSDRDCNYRSAYDIERGTAQGWRPALVEDWRRFGVAHAAFSQRLDAAHTDIEHNRDSLEKLLRRVLVQVQEGIV